MINVKIWWKSKTLWVNVIAFVALLLQVKYGFILDPIEQAAIITIANLILRGLTNSGLELKE